MGVSEVRKLRPHEQPPPEDAAGATAVYIFQTAGGYFYVGETDSLRQRIEQHRRGAAGGAAAFAYVIVEITSGGKSVSRAIESALQRRLARTGYPLLSLHDAANRGFGGATL